MQPSKDVTLLALASMLLALGFGVALRAALARARDAEVRGSAAEARAAAGERELVSADRHSTEARRQLEFLSRFVRAFPHLTRDLHTTVRQRDVAGLVLNVVARTFEPKLAVVLLRRQRQVGTTETLSRFDVAAATSGAQVQLGAEVPALRALLGLAVEGQTLVSRRDLQPRLAPSPHPTASDREFDIVAPLVFGEETLGAIALAHPMRATEEEKAALRLIAQAGAQALHGAAAYQQMKTTANVDGLTRVFNKRHLSETLGEAIVDAQRRQTPLAVFLLDVDNFKHYNDTNGHVAGDHLLRALAQLIQQNVREEDVFGRFGGEEFLLILRDTRLAEGLAVAEKLRALIASHPFACAERQPLGCVSVSGGVAEYPDDALDSTRLLKVADAALYRAKRSGRNLVRAAERTFLGGAALEPTAEPCGELDDA